MAETIKSALFVDYDSIHRSLKAQSRQAAERFAQRSSTWIAAIESGRLVKGGATARRRMMIRRCYADPQLLGKSRLAFVAGGFEVIDCPPLEGQERNSADIHIALDAMDALDHPNGYDEFVLLSADTDLSPVVTRLRAHDRTAIVYVNGGTPAHYREIADGLVDEAPLIAILAAEEAPLAADGARVAAPTAAGSGSRADIEVLARKVHGATNVPLFSPKTFADLFRLLAAEISEGGYHFQNTAENVAAKLVAAGRNVSRRQVVFVVKGLALKGHVFSTTDTPEKLAEVFREQVLYLVGNGGLTLDSDEAALLPAWISGASAAPPAAEPEPVKPASEEPPRPSRRRPAKPAPTPAAKEASPARPAPPPARVAPPTAVAVEPTPATPAPAAPAPTPRPAPKTVEDIRTAAAARLAAAKASVATPPKAVPAAPAKTPPTAPTRLAAIAAKTPPPAAARPAQAARPTPPPAPKPAPPTSRPPAAPPASEANKEALESSILAAIAQAVDVLVEDGNGAEPTTPELAEASAAPADSQPEPQPSEGGDSDDIGDEIQRIIASYSRARQTGERG